MSRRDSNDVEWQNVKKRIKKRDKNRCRLCEIMTIKEFLLFQKSNPVNTGLDPAHCLPVSTHPGLCYVDKNIYSLCRTHHTRIDDFISPITGNACSMNRHYWYWWRIINRSSEDYNKETDYEELVKSFLEN